MFCPSSYAAYKARLVIRVFTEEVGLTVQLVRMYETDFVDVQSLDRRYSVEDAKAVATVEIGTQFLEGSFVVPLPRKGRAKMGPENCLHLQGYFNFSVLL